MRRLLKDIVDIQIGLQFRRKTDAQPDARWRVIHIKDFDENGLLDWEHIDRYDLNIDPSRYLIFPSDVLFLSRGVRLFAYPVERKEPDTLALSHFFILRSRSTEYIPAYLAWILNNKPGQQFINGVAKQKTHMPYIRKSILETFEIPLPPLSIQRKIVEIEKLRKHEIFLVKQIEKQRERLVEMASLRLLQKEGK